MDLKELIYKLVKQDSRNAAKLGNAIGWDYLEQEGNRNVQNPGRAVGKAAATAATWYLGGLMGGAGSAAGEGANAAGNVAGSAATDTASELAKQEALNSAQYAMQQGMLSSGGLMSGQAGMSGAMESALTDSGYTPSSLMNAAKYGPGSGQGMMQTMGNYGRGLMGRVSSPGFKEGAARDFAFRQGMSMMQPQQQQYTPPPPPRYQDPGPMISPYMTEEEKRRLMMLQMQRGY